MTLEPQKELAQRLGLQSGTTPPSGLHISPFVYKMKQTNDDEITVIVTREPPPNKEKAVNKLVGDKSGTPVSKLWHTDGQFEHVTPEYAVLRTETKPATGADTLWASCYEVYDSMSRPVQSFPRAAHLHWWQSGLSRKCCQERYRLL